MKKISNLENRLIKFSVFDIHIALCQSAKHYKRIDEKTIACNTWHPLSKHTQPQINVYSSGNFYYLDLIQNDHNGAWKDQLVLPSLNSLNNLVDVIEDILK